MRRVVTTALGLVCAAGLAFVSAAQAPQPSGVSAYTNQCATCHGADLTGAKSPAILNWVRFHVDKEIVEMIRKGHHGVPAQMPDAELRQLLADMRKLAGTN